MIPGSGRREEGDVIRPDWKAPLAEAFEQALAYLESLPSRPLGPAPDLDGLRKALGGSLPDAPADPRAVVAELSHAADAGIMPSGSGRYYGFVVGGAMPAALAADWLTTAWDQNAGLAAMGPSAAVVEEIAGAWVVDVLGLPAGASVGFVTGAQTATLTGLAIAFAEVLRAEGWDVVRQGLWGAPRVRVLAGEGRHGTIDRALRFLGAGTDAVVPIPADDQGRTRLDALRAALAEEPGPVVVCAQLGNVNSGALDPVGEICDLAHERGAWVHVDGAFGLWAAASPRLRPLVAGVERADSWATDGHKWLNVPYDSGIVVCAHPEAHRAVMGARAGYLVTADGQARDGIDYGPDHSRRARGFAVYAGLRALGRQGVADLVERGCSLARRFAEQLAAADGVEVLNDVVLNQVLVRFIGPDGDPVADDERTRRVVERVQAEGTAWLSGTLWQGRAAMRISVSNWSTDAADVDATVAAILRCARD
jgi:glutamate/tyrosine decarboxylase-like PLP-dependent enzyme